VQPAQGENAGILIKTGTVLHRARSFHPAHGYPENSNPDLHWPATFSLARWNKGVARASHSQRINFKSDHSPHE
jgi:hypothetical protein